MHTCPTETGVTVKAWTHTHIKSGSAQGGESDPIIIPIHLHLIASVDDQLGLSITTAES